MDFQTRNSPEAVEVHMTGRLEFTDHDRLSDIVALIEQSRARRFVIDVSQLEFIDSAGLGMLLILQDEAETRNVKLIVRGPRGAVRQSIDLARIGEIVTFEY